jgi:membrane-associated phospholipid phosphatase
VRFVRGGHGFAGESEHNAGRKTRNPHRRTPMNRKEKLFLLVLVCATLCWRANPAYAQNDPASLPDAPSHCRYSADGRDSTSEREVTLRSLPKDFLHDQKDIWLFPVQLGKGRHWLPTLFVVGGTAGLIVSDAHAMPYFQSHARNLDDINDVFDSPITAAEVVAVPASVLVSGYVRHDSYETSTALLAGEAYADSAIVDLAIKAVTRRERPSDIPPGGSFSDTFFNGSKSPFKGSSFPSGHAAAVFSVATVVATRYRHHRWVPLAAYAFATAVSFSRVTTSAHFPSDVFLGAALGYTITRYEVLRPTQ